MNNIALLRSIALSAYRTSMIIVMALCFLLVSQTTVCAQMPTNYGKPLIVNGKLLYVPTANYTSGSTLTSGGMFRYFHYEPIGNKSAKVDYISKAPDKHLSLRINSSDYAICLIRKKVPDGSNKNNPSIRFSGTLRVSSATPAPAPTVAEEEKKSDEKKSEAEPPKPEQIFPILVLLQDKNGLIRLLIQTDEITIQEYQVKNFWELFILIPDNFQKDFFELLKLYNPSEFTSEQNTIHRIYNAISKSVPLDENVHAEYQKLIDDLSSDVYLKRVAAMNRIQDEGVNFFAFVQKMDLNQLEPEAQVRLGDLISNDSFFCDTDDIEDMSVLFANSFYANIPLLESDNPPFYSIAQKRFKEKLGDSFDFDKSAPADVRAEKIQELKNRFGFPKPRIIKMDEQTQKRFKNLLDALFDQNLTVFKF